ncbi:MAG: hypothetical protein PVF87_12480 [Acidimicrobiia bacterium]
MPDEKLPEPALQLRPGPPHLAGGQISGVSKLDTGESPLTNRLVGLGESVGAVANEPGDQIDLVDLVVLGQLPGQPDLERYQPSTVARSRR